MNARVRGLGEPPSRPSQEMHEHWTARPKSILSNGSACSRQGSRYACHLNDAIAIWSHSDNRTGQIPPNRDGGVFVNDGVCRTVGVGTPRRCFDMIAASSNRGPFMGGGCSRREPSAQQVLEEPVRRRGKKKKIRRKRLIDASPQDPRSCGRPPVVIGNRRSRTFRSINRRRRMSCRVPILHRKFLMVRCISDDGLTSSPSAGRHLRPIAINREARRRQRSVHQVVQVRGPNQRNRDMSHAIHGDGGNDSR